jgi:hypothetical protein
LAAQLEDRFGGWSGAPRPSRIARSLFSVKPPIKDLSTNMAFEKTPSAFLAYKGLLLTESQKHPEKSHSIHAFKTAIKIDQKI